MQNTAAMNVVMMAHVGYPRGMAGTQLIQNRIDALREDPSRSVRVMILRQERTFQEDNPPHGEYKGVTYQTVGSQMRPGLSAVLELPGYIREGKDLLRQWFRPDARNILFVYGPPSGDNLGFVKFARRLGYRVVFYLVEDIRVQGHAGDLFARIKHASAVFLTRRIGGYADGILVISRRLQEWVESLVRGRCPVWRLPICANLDEIPVADRSFGNPVRLFYGGTFAEKDRVELLLDAFDALCGRGRELRLVLTGRGSSEREAAVRKKAEAMTCRDRIDWLGYLEAGEYYRRLGEYDILCMTRGSSAFSRAGFPFKLGEYLATGRPVIASRVSDVAEYLTDRRDAILVEPDSAEAIAAGVDWLLDHPDPAREIGREGRRTAEREFDFRQQGRRLCEWMEGLDGASTDFGVRT